MMKIRRKENGEVFEVLEESPNYYLVQAKPFTPFTFKKDSCEPVPEERWVDVTGECRCEGEGLMHDGGQLAHLYLANPGGRYRLRKVKLYEITGHGSLPTYEYLKAVDAFIIEKKET